MAHDSTLDVRTHVEGADSETRMTPTHLMPPSTRDDHPLGRPHRILS